MHTCQQGCVLIQTWRNPKAGVTSFADNATAVPGWRNPVEADIAAATRGGGVAGTAPRMQRRHTAAQ
eukprot:353079-Chlamydomonas_euryale.AAC.5